MTRNDNITIFQSTLSYSSGKLLTHTLRSTRLTEFVPDITRLNVERVEPKDNIVFEEGGTASTAYKYADGKSRVALLNFACPTHMGGGVKRGAFAQEENLCRCTNLFTVLQNSIRGLGFYIQNIHANKYEPGIYTHGAIYSKDVMIFRDDEDYHLIPPRPVDVITCPAPSVQNSVALSAIQSRAEGIIKLAASMRVDTLILGAWGCGAFGQSPMVVGKSFKEALNKYNHFSKVVFAVRPTFGDNETFNLIKKYVEEN